MVVVVAAAAAALLFFRRSCNTCCIVIAGAIFWKNYRSSDNSFEITAVYLTNTLAYILCRKSNLLLIMLQLLPSFLSLLVETGIAVLS